MNNCPKCGNPMEECEKDGDKEHKYFVCHPCEYVVKARVCEVYSRVCGYLRPISGWNLGKKNEFKDRKTYKIEKWEKARKEIDERRVKT